MIYGSAPYWIPFRSFGHLQVSEPAYSLHPLLPNSGYTSILTSKCETADPNNLSRYSRSYAPPASPMWARQLMLEKGIFSRLLEDLKHTAQMTQTSKECCPLTWHNSLCRAVGRWKVLILSLMFNWSCYFDRLISTKSSFFFNAALQQFL